MGRPAMVDDAARTPRDAAFRLRPVLEKAFPRQAPAWYEHEIALILGEARDRPSQAVT